MKSETNFTHQENINSSKLDGYTDRIYDIEYNNTSRWAAMMNINKRMNEVGGERIRT